MASGVHERPYLSIGEVLGLLLEEFPDVTISKIRFLESQGLIEPERTSSGYRKFYDTDVERLKMILREQRENYLPLRVIRDRLETGAIDESGSIATPPAPSARSARITSKTLAPRGIRNIRLDDQHSSSLGADGTGPADVPPRPATTSRHPAAQTRMAPSPPPLPTVAASNVYLRGDLCNHAGITDTELADLESYGLVVGRGSGLNATYTDSDLAIVRAAGGFLQRGIDARHLRAWRQAAEREAGLFEQLILPLLRQRNPQARSEAIGKLNELARLGADLREAIVHSALRQHLEP